MGSKKIEKVQERFLKVADLEAAGGGDIEWLKELTKEKFNEQIKEVYGLEDQEIPFTVYELTLQDHATVGMVATLSLWDGDMDTLHRTIKQPLCMERYSFDQANDSSAKKIEQIKSSIAASVEDAVERSKSDSLINLFRVEYLNALYVDKKMDHPLWDDRTLKLDNIKIDIDRIELTFNKYMMVTNIPIPMSIVIDDRKSLETMMSPKGVKLFAQTVYRSVTQSQLDWPLINEKLKRYDPNHRGVLIIDVSTYKDDGGDGEELRHGEGG